MKKLFCFVFVISLVQISVKAQTASEQLSEKIAKKMKDSLSLTGQQKNAIYTINIQIANRKAAVREQNVSSDSLSLKIQRVENTRDSLYRNVMTEQQFLLYKQKKRNLINNN